MYFEPDFLEKLHNDKNDEALMEQKQRLKLNSYFKKLLPTLPNIPSLDLRLLYRTTVCSSDFEALFEKINVTKESNKFHVASFIGPPGCGKVFCVVAFNLICYIDYSNISGCQNQICYIF